MVRLQITMREEYQPPDDGKQQPRQKERRSEHQQRPSPLGVDQGREDVLQEPQAPSGPPALEDVALSVLEDRSSPDLADRPRPELFPATKSQVQIGYCELFFTDIMLLSAIF